MEQYKIRVMETLLFVQADYARINIDGSLDFLLFAGLDKTVLSLLAGEWLGLARVKMPCVPQAREEIRHAHNTPRSSGIQPSA